MTLEQRRLIARTALTDVEWERVKPLLALTSYGGRPISVSRREILSAIRYWQSSTEGWRKLPPCFPSWATVHHYYRVWVRDGLWEQIEARLRGEE